MAQLITNNNYQDFTLAMLQTPDGIAKLNSILSQLSQNISGDTEQVRVYSGVGTPEASVAAGVGSLYMRTDGGSDTSVYRKESGSADTGWIAIKAPASLPLSVANGGTGVDNSAATANNFLYFSSTGVIGNRALSNTDYGNVAGAYTAGTYLICTIPIITNVGTSFTVYTKMLEIRIPRGGTLTIKFGISAYNDGARTGFGKIYRNGSAVGTERTSSGSGTDWADYSEDISGWTAGDLLQIYSKIDAASAIVLVGALRLYTGLPVIEALSSSIATLPVTYFIDGAATPSTLKLNTLGNIGDRIIRNDNGVNYVKTAATTWV